MEESERIEAWERNIQDERIANKTSESAGCQGHPNVRAADLSKDGTGADCVRE